MREMAATTGDADGDIRNKHAVHDVDVDVSCARFLDQLDVATEMHEIGRQDGWRYFHRFEHARVLPHRRCAHSSARSAPAATLPRAMEENNVFKGI